MDQFLYWAFHFIIILSLTISYAVYSKMKFPSLHTAQKVAPVLIFFVIWDFLVTGTWWHFNPDYVTSLTYIPQLRLPLEEILFFITVPFAILTLVENMLSKDWFLKQLSNTQYLTSIIGAVKLVLGVLLILSVFNTWWYTATVLLLLIVLDYNMLKKRSFFLGFVFTLGATLIFNYYLTSIPIVLYNDMYKSSILIGTIPIEDFGYAVILYILLIKRAYATKKT